MTLLKLLDSALAGAISDFRRCHQSWCFDPLNPSIAADITDRAGVVPAGLARAGIASSGISGRDLSICRFVAHFSLVLASDYRRKGPSQDRHRFGAGDRCCLAWQGLGRCSPDCAASTAMFGPSCRSSGVDSSSSSCS